MERIIIDTNKEELSIIQSQFVSQAIKGCKSFDNNRCKYRNPDGLHIMHCWLDGNTLRTYEENHITKEITAKVTYILK